MFGVDVSASTDAPRSAVLPRDREEIRQLIVFSCFGVVMGIVGGVVAWVLYHLINIITGLAFFRAFTTKSPLYPPPEGLGLMAIVIPVVGALAIGLMAKYGSERIRGHGIPEAMEAVLRHKSQVGIRVAIFKPLSAAIAVGTGGPFGAEGPVIQTGGAIGSLIGQTMRLSAKERRILLACGGAAGMVGIFNTPVAAVALALELLLFEFRARSLIPVILASATAAGLRTVLLGSGPMFKLGVAPGIGGPLDLLWFVPLGLLIGVCSVLISKALYVVEEFFDGLKIDVIFKPMLGALVLGIVAVFQPRVLGMGYTYITDVLRNQYTNGTLVSLAAGKSIALIASLGSGTSGGLLAPMLLIGAAMGCGFGRGILALVPGAGINPAICGIVAMSSLFSAAARAPLTSFLFAFELTGDYKAILPLMIGCMVADVVSRSLSRESVMTERLVRRGLRVDQGYEMRLLNFVAVGDVMAHTLDTLSERTPLRAVLRGLLGEPVALSLLHVYNLPSPSSSGHSGESSGARQTTISGPAPSANDDEIGGEEVCSIGLHQHWAFPVVDDEGRLSGIVTRGELLSAANDKEALDDTVGDLAIRRVVVAYPDESLDAALMRMLTGDYQMLPVVERENPRKLIGVLGRRDILRAWQLRDLDETQRERLLSFSRRWGRERKAAEPVAAQGPVTVTTMPETMPTGALYEHSVDTLTLPGEDATWEDALAHGSQPDRGPNIEAEQDERGFRH